MVRGRPTGLLQSVGGLSAAAMHGGGLWGRASQVSKEPQTKGVFTIGDWQAPGDILLWTVSLVECLVYEIRKKIPGTSLLLSIT